MSSLFEGLSGLLNDVFGDPVQIETAASGVDIVQAVFRRDPVSVADDDGREFLIISPTLRMLKQDAQALAKDDLVHPPGAQSYAVVAKHPTNGNPAEDAFVYIELEEAFL